MDNWLYYAAAGGLQSTKTPDPADKYEAALWRPSVKEVVPTGMRLLPWGVWWLMHQCRLFGNEGYAQLIIRHAGAIVHRSVVTPPYFRFPFMDKSDLQVGDTWTDPAHRNKGLAKRALNAIVASGSPAQRFWYVVEGGNGSSIRVVESCGFRLVGRGRRISRFGLSVCGAFIMTKSEEGITI